VSPLKPAGLLGGQFSRREFTKVCTSSWVAYWVRYGLILRMLNGAKRQDLETEAMWFVKVSWSSIMTPRFLAVLDGTRDKESILMLMLWWMACLAGKPISSVLARFRSRCWCFIHVDISARQSEIRAETVVSSGGKDRNSRSEEHTSELQSHLNLVCRLVRG